MFEIKISKNYNVPKSQAGGEYVKVSLNKTQIKYNKVIIEKQWNFEFCLEDFVVELMNSDMELLSEYVKTCDVDESFGESNGLITQNDAKSFIYQCFVNDFVSDDSLKRVNNLKKLIHEIIDFNFEEQFDVLDVVNLVEIRTRFSFAPQQLSYSPIVGIACILDKYNVEYNDIRKKLININRETYYCSMGNSRYESNAIDRYIEEIDILLSPIDDIRDLNIVKEFLKLDKRKEMTFNKRRDILGVYELSPMDQMRYIKIKNEHFRKYNVLSFHEITKFATYCYIISLKKGIKIKKCLECGKYFVSHKNSNTCSVECRTKRRYTTAKIRSKNITYKKAETIRKRYYNCIGRFEYDKESLENENIRNVMSLCQDYYCRVITEANDIILGNKKTCHNNKEFSDRYEEWLSRINCISNEFIRNVIKTNTLEIVLFDFYDITKEFEVRKSEISSMTKIEEFFNSIHEMLNRFEIQ